MKTCLQASTLLKDKFHHYQETPLILFRHLIPLKIT